MPNKLSLLISYVLSDSFLDAFLKNLLGIFSVLDTMPGAEIVNLSLSPLRQNFSNLTVPHTPLERLLKLWAPSPWFLFL
jgi:hypothetical protein